MGRLVLTFSSSQSSPRANGQVGKEVKSKSLGRYASRHVVKACQPGRRVGRPAELVGWLVSQVGEGGEGVGRVSRSVMQFDQQVVL